MKELRAKCKGRVPILLHPCFYRALKIKFPLDVGGLAKKGIVTKTLGKDNLGDTVGILTRADFLSVLDTE